MGSINGNEGDLTGLGNDTSYYNKDLYVQWETSDGKVSDKVPLGTFITGHPSKMSKIPSSIPLRIKSITTDGQAYSDVAITDETILNS